MEHSANGNTSRNGNVEDSSTPEAETPSESMDVEPSQRGTSILSNPARFEALIRSLGIPDHLEKLLLCRFGRGLQQFSVQLEQEKGRNEANTTMLQVTTHPLLENGECFKKSNCLTFFCRRRSACWPTQTPGTPPLEASWSLRAENPSVLLSILPYLVSVSTLAFLSLMILI